jgi:phosphomannomutase
MWIIDVMDNPAISGVVEESKVLQMLDLNFPGIVAKEGITLDEDNQEFSYNDYEIILRNANPEPKVKLIVEVEQEEKEEGSAETAKKMIGAKIVPGKLIS